MSRRPQQSPARSTYELIQAHSDQFGVRMMCRILGVFPSGYYKWLLHPLSNRAQEDARLLRLIRASFTASHGNLRRPSRISRLARGGRDLQQAPCRAAHARERPPRATWLSEPAIARREAGRADSEHPAATVHSRAAQQGVGDGHHLYPDVAGWLYLAIVMDLFSRKVVGWATASTIRRELVLDAVLMAVRRRRPRGTVIHSDQGTQFGSDAWPNPSLAA